MKNQMLFFVFLFVISALSAQDREYEFGKVALNDFEYTQCPFDKEAEAVVIYDKGESSFVEREGNFSVLFKRFVRIKVLSDAGAEWGNVEIPYYQSNNIYESINELEAVSYNFENGILKRTELDKSSYHSEKKSENWMIKKFAIPNVKAGTVIEYQYSIESQYVFNLRDWEFQWRIPVLYSEYVVNMIPFYQYSFLLQGATKFDKQTSVVSNNDRQYGSIKYQDYVHTYVMKNIPAFKDEEFITSSNDYIIKLDFQLSKIFFPGGYDKDIITTWPLLIKDMLAEDTFGKYVLKAEKLSAKIFDLTKFAIMTQQQKFDSVINYVKKTYIWNKKERLYASKSIKQLQEDKFGNSADINLFTIGLLKGVGLTAQPVIISTRENGKIKHDYPFLDFFDNVLIKADIDSSEILSDATDILIANNRVPVNCINDRGLVIQKDKVEWVDLKARTLSKIRTTIIMNLSGNQLMSGVSVSASEYDGLYFRKKFGIDKQAILKQLSEKEYDVNDSTLAIKNMENFSSPFSLRYKVETKPQIIGNKVYISPFLKEVIQTNPLKQQSRTYPIDINYAQQRVYVSTITIPEGYKIDFLPANKSIKNTYFEMYYDLKEFNGIVNISFAYSFKLPVYQAGDYLLIKSFYNDIINKSNEKIVFVKQ
jgi:hypothetical protein